MQHDPNIYYRARVKAIDDLMAALPASPGKDSKSEQRYSVRRFLAMGYVMPGLKDWVGRLIEQHIPQVQSDYTLNGKTMPLGHVELATYDTWFQLHPEKVCGEEVVTYSLFFPITIKGDRETVERTMLAGATTSKPSADSADLDRDAILKLMNELDNL